MIYAVLSRNVVDMMINGRLQGFKEASTIPPSVIQKFVDDTFLFGISSVIEAKLWNNLLVDYAYASRQYINYDKSNIFFFNTFVNLQFKILSILGCKSATLLGTWVGLPLTVKEVTPTFWNNILERIQKKFIGCKGKFLSSAGKLQLLAASLQGISMYFLSLFKISCAMREKLERIQITFLWMGMEEKKQLSLVNWDTVCLPKSIRGLSIRKINALNKALIAKVGWTLAKGEAAWCNIIRAKYLEREQFYCNLSAGDLPHGSKLWNNILKLRPVIREGLEWQED